MIWVDLFKSGDCYIGDRQTGPMADAGVDIAVTPDNCTVKTMLSSAKGNDSASGVGTLTELSEKGSPMTESIYMSCDCGKRWKVEAPPEGRLRSMQHIDGDCKIDWEAPAGDKRLPKLSPADFVDEELPGGNTRRTYLPITPSDDGEKNPDLSSQP